MKRKTKRALILLLAVPGLLMLLGGLIELSQTPNALQYCALPSASALDAAAYAKKREQMVNALEDSVRGVAFSSVADSLRVSVLDRSEDVTVYAVGDILCHQESGRSFHLNGSQLPICVRDISALAGLFAGMCAAMRIGRYTSERRFCVPFLIVSFGLMIADVVIQNVFSLNVVPARVVTGFLCGLSVSFAIDMWFRSFEPRHDE